MAEGGDADTNAAVAGAVLGASALFIFSFFPSLSPYLLSYFYSTHIET
jgi:ADP-ribosylglycohydrolase